MNNKKNKDKILTGRQCPYCKRKTDAELREYKKQAHEYFDKIWQLKIFTRSLAYKLLAEKMGVKRLHIGHLNVEKCKEVIFFSKQLLNDMRRLDLDFGVEPKTEYYENN